MSLTSMLEAFMPFAVYFTNCKIQLFLVTQRHGACECDLEIVVIAVALFNMLLCNFSRINIGNNTRESRKCGLGLPDIPYFTGAPVFEPQSPTSREEATREMKFPVFQLGPVSHHTHTYSVSGYFGSRRCQQRLPLPGSAGIFRKSILATTTT